MQDNLRVFMRRPIDLNSSQLRSQSHLELPTPSTVNVNGRARGQLTNPLDGRYGPMDSSALRAAIGRLVDCVDLAGVDYVIGIPEGGMIPAYAFGIAAGLPIVLASVWQPDLPGLISFYEDHDPPAVSRKHIYGLVPGNNVIIVEDEVTSGNTVVNCVRALRAAGIRCDQVATIYASDDPEMRSRLSKQAIQLHVACLFSKDIGDRLNT
jgi:adenine/guanine phosphoribosyltransferase-like PRPP-binding protein